MKDLQIRKKSKKFSDLDSKKTFVELYGKNKELIERFADFLKKSKEYDLSEKDVIELIKNKEKFIAVPVSIFRNKLGPLEAVVQYLREEGYKLKEIALLLNRSNKTIWTTYDNAVKKNVKLEISDELFIPLSIISNRRLSALENICSYLKERLQFSISNIAKLLERNKNTIWTVCSRAVKKLDTQKPEDFDK